MPFKRSLSNRLSSTIINYFKNCYSKLERAQVVSVVIDLKTQYHCFIRQLFSNTKIIIDLFHIAQLAGRALESYRIDLIRSVNKYSQSQRRLFHKKFDGMILKLLSILGKSMNI